jgi:hypothetical protein
MDPTIAALKIRRAWSRWLARRAGPLLWFRAESNNPYDFYSSDPVAEIPMRDFVSFVDGGKGYVMDIKSAASLVDHAKTNGEAPLNPFNRAALPVSFLRRLNRHVVKGKVATLWTGLTATGEVQVAGLAATDVFRVIEDLGYYTDPSWFMDLTRLQLQRLYIELADIWYHRATLSVTDRARIVPVTGSQQRRAFPLPVSTVLIMQQRALRPLLLETCKLLVSAAAARSDRQLGVMYVLGAMAMVSPGAAVAYPWLVDMFSPGATRIVGSQIVALHPSVLAY